MLNFQFALHSSSCYPEWDSRQNGWVATLEGITGLGGEHVCTYLLSGDFPRPQLFRKCRDCKDLEICEYCAVTKHASHNLSKDIFGPGFCDEKTNLETCLTIPKAIKQQPHQCHSKNVRTIHHRLEISITMGSDLKQALPHV